ncbi:hypothetical protein C5E11_04025 [Clavibacter michiganensis]|nr:hypothetical protein [Clavibacter michiganensis]PPF64565.1 hypothetical protein C5E11_04025 [Clavibacter michiganensis]
MTRPSRDGGKPSVFEFDNMQRRSAGESDRWIVFKLQTITPERWATGPRGVGVYADVALRRRWILFPSLIAAGDHARKSTTRS